MVLKGHEQTYLSDQPLTDPGEQIKKFALVDRTGIRSFFASAFDCLMHSRRDTAFDDFEDFVTRLGVYMYLKTEDYDLTSSLRHLAAHFVDEVALEE